jgi:hypothetical protein
MGAIIAGSLSQYISIIVDLRQKWARGEEKELWFRAEDESHSETRLQPGLYRPAKGKPPKPVAEILKLENFMYDEFQRCATQISDVGRNNDDWEWDSYFLMQHHGVPTRILDWSDGALIALHFAVRGKPLTPTSGSIVYVLDPYWLNEILKQHGDRKDAESRWKQFSIGDPYNTCEDEWDRLYLLENRRQVGPSQITGSILSGTGGEKSE